jgi:hypothetical protein
LASGSSSHAVCGRPLGHGISSFEVFQLLPLLVRDEKIAITGVEAKWGTGTPALGIVAVNALLDAWFSVLNSIADVVLGYS